MPLGIFIAGIGLWAGAGLAGIGIAPPSPIGIAMPLVLCTSEDGGLEVVTRFFTPAVLFDGTFLATLFFVADFVERAFASARGIVMPGMFICSAIADEENETSARLLAANNKSIFTRLVSRRETAQAERRLRPLIHLLAFMPSARVMVHCAHQFLAAALVHAGHSGVLVAPAQLHHRTKLRICAYRDIGRLSGSKCCRCNRGRHLKSS